MDNTKYHVSLNNQPLIIDGYTKSEAPAFTPRVSGGDQTDADFSMLLSRSLDGFSGGMLQRYWQDDNAIYASENLFPIYNDGVLYPVNAPTSSTGFIGKSVLTAHVVTRDYQYYAYQNFAGSTNVVKRMDRFGNVVSITLPVSLSSGPHAITSMVFWNNQIWFGTDTGNNTWYLDIASTSVTLVGGTGGFQLMVVWRGSLYGTNNNSSSTGNSTLYLYSGSTATTGFTSVGSTGMNSYDYTARLCNFGGKIILTRRDGMYAYDGVAMTPVLDASSNWHDYNFRHASILFGYLHYFMPDGFWRYNGSTVEKLYDINEIGFPVDVCTGKNRLWFLYNNSSNGSSRYDKTVGYDYSSGNNLDGRVAAYDGRGIFTYGRVTTFVKNPGTEDFSGQEEVNRVIVFNDVLYITLNHSKLSTYHSINLNELAATGNKTWSIITSTFNANFEQIDKNIDNLQLVLDGNIISDQTVDISYRTSGFDGSVSFTTLGTFKFQTKLKEFIFSSLPAGISTKRIQFKLSGTTDARTGLAKFIVRYTLNPDFKWQWQFTALAYGDSDLEPLELADGSKDTTTVDIIRGAIYTARSSDVPVPFVDVDQLDLNGAIGTGNGSIVLNNTRLLKGDDGFVKIDNEIMYWSAKTSTTLTVTRGVLGTSAAVHSDNAKVFPVYRVLVERINNERIELQAGNPDATEDKSRPSRLTLVLREV